MCLSPTGAARWLRRIQFLLLLCAAALLPAPLFFTAVLLLTAAALYDRSALRVRHLRLLPEGLRLSGGIFCKEILRISSGTWIGLRIFLLPGVREVFLLLPHRTIYLFPMTAAQLHILQKYMEPPHEA
ncbi:MAG: hypothetical protein IJY28_05840 [Clostridia bacterium]|nr:hypothetical protein [Clostridia bacterium]